MLSDSQILKEIYNGNIVIDPFDTDNLGSNSYDLHLSKHVAEYDNIINSHVERTGYHLGLPHRNGGESHIETTVMPLDSKEDNKLKRYEIGVDGLVLYPGRFYLMSTEEFTFTKGFVPFIDGKSSIGRLGIKTHFTAGKGDNGFSGNWTLEVEVALPVKVYAGMAFAQIYYFETGDCINPYDTKKSAKYNGANILPQGSAMWKNFLK